MNKTNKILIFQIILFLALSFSLIRCDRMFDYSCGENKYRTDQTGNGYVRKCSELKVRYGDRCPWYCSIKNEPYTGPGPGPGPGSGVKECTLLINALKYTEPFDSFTGIGVPESVMELNTYKTPFEGTWSLVTVQSEYPVLNSKYVSPAGNSTLSQVENFILDNINDYIERLEKERKAIPECIVFMGVMKRLAGSPGTKGKMPKDIAPNRSGGVVFSLSLWDEARLLAAPQAVDSLGRYEIAKGIFEGRQGDDFAHELGHAFNLCHPQPENLCGDPNDIGKARLMNPDRRTRENYSPFFSPFNSSRLNKLSEDKDNYPRGNMPFVCEYRKWDCGIKKEN